MAVLPNPKHELFAQGLAKGETADAAYANAGFKPNRGNATRLKANESVVARVAELQQRAASRAEKTVDDIILHLEADRVLAHREGQAGAAVSASLGMAKVLGLIIDKKEHSGSIGIRHEDALNALR